MSTIQEPQALNDVMKFHQLFDAYTGESPHLPPSEICALRVTLLQEELDELKKAIEEKDIVEIADALVDLQYVLSGAVIAFGLQEMFAELFTDVQNSNMSKACASAQEAEETITYYQTQKNTEGYMTSKDGKYIVKRVGDEKILKSVNYQPANLGDKLNQYITKD